MVRRWPSLNRPGSIAIQDDLTSLAIGRVCQQWRCSDTGVESRKGEDCTRTSKQKRPKFIMDEKAAGPCETGGYSHLPLQRGGAHFARLAQGLLSVFAEFERDILGERVRAGLAEALRNGTKLGRPVTAAKKTSQIRKLHRAGVSKAEIARRLDIGRTSVRRILSADDQ